MATSKKTVKQEEAPDLIQLETRKVKALEKIANSLEGLTIWFEDIDKQEWSDRIQYYLAEFHNVAVPGRTDDETLNEGSK